MSKYLSTLDKEGSLSQESYTLRVVPAPGETHLAHSPGGIQGQLKWDSSKDPVLGKGISALRSHLERRPGPRGGDHCHGSSKKVHLGVVFME